MKAFLEDLFAYHHHFNQKMADLFIEHNKEINKSTLALYSHSIHAHQVWNARILKESIKDIHEVESLTQCIAIDQSNYAVSLQILRDFDCSTPIIYKNSKGSVFHNTVHEILFHVTNHFTHHRAQISSVIRRAGIEPIPTDYIFYKR